MKLRKWAFLLGGLFILGSLAIYLSRDLINANERIKLLIQKEAGQQLGEDINIDFARIGFPYIALDNLGVSFNEGADSIAIRELRIGWSIYEFVKSWFNPQKGVTEIRIIESHIIIGAQQTKQVEDLDKDYFSERSDQILDQIEATTKKFLGSFQNITRLEISDATIYFKNRTGDVRSIAHDVNGEIAIDEMHDAKVALDAKLLNAAEKNLQISADIDLEHFNFFADLKLQDYDLSTGLPDWISQKVQFDDGMLNGHVHISKDYGSQGQHTYFVNGSVDIKKASYHIVQPDLWESTTSWKVTNANISAKIEQNVITIESFVQEFADGEIAISGKILNPLDPECNFAVTLSHIDLSRLQKDSQFAGKNDIQGIIDGSLSMSGPLFDPEITGTLHANTLIVNTKQLEQFNSSIRFNYPELVFENVNAHYKQTDIISNVMINFDVSDPLKITGTIKGDLLSLLENNQLNKNNEYSGEADFTFQGSFDNLTGDGTITLTSKNGKGEKIISGIFQLTDSIYIQGQSEDKDFGFKGTISTDLSSYQIYFSDALPVIQHEFGLSDAFFSKTPIILNMKVIGDEGKIKLIANTLSTKSDTLFTFHGDYVRKSDDTGFLKSDFTIPLPNGKSFRISSELSKNGQHYEIKNIESPGYFKGSGEIIENGELSISGEIEFDSTIEYLNTLLGFELLDEGDLTGRMYINGTLNNPEIKGNFYFVNGVKNSVSDLSGSLEFASNEWGKFNSESISLQHNNFQFLRGEAEVDCKKGIGELNVAGDQVPSEVYSALFALDGELLKGDISYKLQYKYNKNNNNLTGTLEIPQGQIGLYAFQDMKMTLASPNDAPNGEYEGIINSDGIIPKGVWVQDFTVTTLKDVPVNGEGYISFTKDVESDFNVSIRGDILSIFTKTNPFFKYSDGNGEASIIIGGNLLNPVISSGNITIKDGTLYLNNIINKIEHIYLEAELQSDNRFIDIKRLEADLDGKPAWIENEPEVTTIIIFDKGPAPDTLTFPLIPIELMDDGLNLGILTLHTSKKGVTLHIPDLMRKKETGNIRFAGLNDTEKFYFAGGNENSDHYYVRGKIILRDGRITYPAEITDEESVWVYRFLENINWDLQVVPESNNFYVRNEPVSDIPAWNDLWGDIKIELKIEDEEDGLYFAGIVDDVGGIPFDVSRDLRSRRGDIKFLLQDFKVENFELYFKECQPYIKGVAKTTRKEEESLTGAYVDIYLHLVSDEKDVLGNNTGKLLDYGTWDENDEPTFRYILSYEPTPGDFSPSVIGTNISRETPGTTPLSLLTTEGSILRLLGISPEEIEKTAEQLAVDRAGEVLFNPILDPISKTVRQRLNLDEFSVKTNLRRKYGELGLANLKNRYEGLGFAPNIPSTSEEAQEQYRFFNPKYIYISPELRVGKYLSPSMYLIYEGRYVSTIDRNQKDVMGLSHIVALQYRMPNSILFEFQYDYDFYRYLDKGDARLWLRHQIRLTGIKKE